ncbi:MAG TPA: 2OG-Fe(II) oxygenase [Rhizomicrobium sp.]
MDKPEEVLARANAGDAEAQIALGRNFEEKGHTPLARAWYARAVKAENPVAMRLLARSLFTLPPMVIGHAVQMMQAAAALGDAEAMHFCALFAAMDPNLPDRWNVACELSGRAAAQGFALAQAEMEFLKNMQGEMETLSRAVPIRMVHESPRIGIVENFASPEICDWFIARAKPRLHRALVHDEIGGGARADDQRDNSSAEFNTGEADLVLLLVQARIAAIADTPRIQLETSSVLHYVPGQRFKPHFDFMEPAVLGHAKDIVRRGQRVATFLLYLNDDYEGGETEFPRLDFRYKGRKGDALMFWNVDPDGRPDLKTLHAGLQTTRGEKWLLSQWLRLPSQ